MAIEQKIGSAKGCWLAFEALQCKEKEIYRCSSMTKVTSNSSKKNRTTLFFWHYTLKQKSGRYNSKTQRNRETKTLTIFLRTQLKLKEFWLLRKGFKVLVSLFLRVLELQITQKSTKKKYKKTLQNIGIFATDGSHPWGFIPGMPIPAFPNPFVSVSLRFQSLCSSPCKW